MNFLKQIKYELKHLMKMRFMMILGIIVLLLGSAFPVLNYAFNKYNENLYDDYGYWGYAEEGQESIEYDGVEITPENPYYSDLYYYTNDCLTYIPDTWTEVETAAAQELVTSLYDICGAMAKEVTTYEDYRRDVGYKLTEKAAKLFVLKSDIEDPDILSEIVQNVTWVENIEEIMAMSEEDKAAEVEVVEAFIKNALAAVTEDDFNKYADCMIALKYDEIESYKTQISNLEASIVADPSLEASLANEIENYENKIMMAETGEIPAWEYRKEKQVLPNSDDWRNNALNAIESATYELQYASEILTAEEFEADYWEKQQYGDYENYKEAKARQVEKAQTNMLIAQNSLDADKPDMKFVYDGARSMVNMNLSYSMVVAFLAIMMGGYIIANEFQSGTVRLLMIRPRTRSKVYGAKFLAGLIYCYVIYLLGMFLNIIVNGVMNGFADYAYPNYSASGPVNFWTMIIGRILCCSLVIIFSYSIAYCLSAVIRNSAVAIALPSAAVFGGMIGMQIIAQTDYAKVLAFTPLPYLNWSSFYTEYGTITSLIDKGLNISESVGVVMLLAISVVCVILGYICFKKNDITN